MYYISECPIVFHDLVEVFEFLVNLPIVYLWQFDGLPVRFDSVDVLYIRVFYIRGSTYVSYQSVRKC